MAALGGSLGGARRAALAAGCDMVLHCNGKMDEMAEVRRRARPLSDAALRRVAGGEARRRAPRAVRSRAGRGAVRTQLMAAA